MTPADCCGATMTAATMDTVRGALTLKQCTRCGRRSWWREGEEAPITEILGAALRKPTRHLVLVHSLPQAA